MGRVKEHISAWIFVSHLGRQRCCRTWFVLWGRGKALLRSWAACRCGYGHDNPDRKWMSTGSRGSTHPKLHPLHVGNTEGETEQLVHRLSTRWDSPQHNPSGTALNECFKGDLLDIELQPLFPQISGRSESYKMPLTSALYLLSLLWLPWYKGKSLGDDSCCLLSALQKASAPTHFLDHALFYLPPPVTLTSETGSQALTRADHGVVAGPVLTQGASALGGEGGGGADAGTALPALSTGD